MPNEEGSASYPYWCPKQHDYFLVLVQGSFARLPSRLVAL